MVEYFIDKRLMPHEISKLRNITDILNDILNL